MKNYRGEVIGALQFINRKKTYDTILNSIDVVKSNVIPFDQKVTDLLRALASQAAVSIENDMLLERINILFDGFVRASVHAIEQRDPTTSGHSFRVADLTTQLAMVLPRSNKPMFKDIQFSDNDIREIRFASLLHDFGKVGVREHVLVKEKKLPAHRLELIRHRIALEKERLYRWAAEQEVALLRTANARDYESQQEQLAKQLLEKVGRLDMLLKVVLDSNEPTILPEEASGLLDEVHRYPYKNIDEQTSGLIDQDELLALSVKKGSLTNDERKEIESHVTHTLKFLSLIPWTPELSRIPAIAASHHEKLNGAGYPAGLKADQIPLPSKLMAISDIFDALTASDRPYKRAVPVEKALGILETEAKGGLLDQDAVDVFVEAKVYTTIEGRDYKAGMSYSHAPKYAHHVCDADVHPDPVSPR
jgi:HD-GYP domain-containing protein (c-di-GMP phosphodiesterase class II)